MRNLLLASVMTLSFITSAYADDIVVGTFGPWKVSSGTTESRPSCQIQTGNYDQEGLELFAGASHPGEFDLIVSRLSWMPHFQQGSQQTMTFNWSSGPQTLVGTTDSYLIQFKLNASNFPQFLHGFTSGASVGTNVQGVPTGQNTFDLTGTSAAVAALAKCVQDRGIAPLPWPSSNKTTSSGAPTSPSSSSSVVPPPVDQEAPTNSLATASDMRAWMRGSFVITELDTEGLCGIIPLPNIHSGILQVESVLQSRDGMPQLATEGLADNALAVAEHQNMHDACIKAAEPTTLSTMWNVIHAGQQAGY
ncbi:hypothetical protein [Acidisoma cladoniae]|jgi:hypothetical protein|uniref:hypothetical protein n=1 Tax=Acidisoma cladoniae TaxID=3040935 RepID=UPI00254A00F7|nr:hypothetical protein [Acidisoma sp. PAMC 29798]